MDKLRLKLSKYISFYNDEVQKDSFECPLLLIDIVNKLFVPCSADERIVTSYRNSLSDLFIFIHLEKYIVCDIRGLRSPSITLTS